MTRLYISSFYTTICLVKNVNLRIISRVQYRKYCFMFEMYEPPPFIAILRTYTSSHLLIVITERGHVMLKTNALMNLSSRDFFNFTFS